MRSKEVVVCRDCGGTDCRVEELFEHERISMEEYERRHRFPQNGFGQYYHHARTARRFLITCQDCGCQHEFQEQVELPPPSVFLKGDAQ